MARKKPDGEGNGAERSDEAGPRAILRVPAVLMAVAERPDGSALVDLEQVLDMPKTSLHRLLRTLEHGGYLIREHGRYRPGPESFRLASTIGLAAPQSDFPACARPVLEWLARESGDTVMLTVLSEQGGEMIYVDVIDSEAPLRFTLRPGHRRPLYSVASGKVTLAFLPTEVQQRYLQNAEFIRFTDDTTSRAEMAEVLQAARRQGVVFDLNGIVDGASAIASPVFDASGAVFCSISVAGPTERIKARRAEFEKLVLSAGHQLSRILGYSGEFPPRA